MWYIHKQPTSLQANSSGYQHRSNALDEWWCLSAPLSANATGSSLSLGVPPVHCVHVQTTAAFCLQPSLHTLTLSQVTCITLRTQLQPGALAGLCTG